MGKPRQQTIYVDSARTQTAADIEDVAHCDALIRRFHRNISELQAEGAEAEGAPRHLHQALFYKRKALREIEKRRTQLLA